MIDDAVHLAQRSFRTLLAALAHPGRLLPLDERIDAPPQLGHALAAGAFSLLDREVAVWLSPAPPQVRAWLVSRTGCRIVETPDEAAFALLLDPVDALPLARWNAGTPEDPERSATLLVRVRDLSGGTPVALAGPGIDGVADLAPCGVPGDFWTQWADNVARYPVGIDCFFFDAKRVVGLPRTAAERLA